MLYYIGYFNCDEIRSENRIVAPAAENKMNYIVSALAEAVDGEIEIISPAQTKEYKFIKGDKRRIGDRVFLKTFATFNCRNKLLRVAGHLLTRLSFLFYLLLSLNSEDSVIVYHSLSYMSIISFLKKIKGFNLVFEVEELYSDVTDDEALRKKEIDYLQIAESYIFVTELLRNKVNKEKKYLTSHGTYNSVDDLNFRFNDDKIHVVYAGTFRKAKGGVYTAISAAEHLDDNYVLEILGNGSENEIQEVKDLINVISAKTSCKINYAGFMSGEAFNKYIQACHIGLSTQPKDAVFNDTSFPSKVLTYMSNGLRVVSVRIPAVETSLVGEYIYYYDVQEAECIAQAIKKAASDSDCDVRGVLDTLSRNFVLDLKDLLTGEKYES